MKPKLTVVSQAVNTAAHQAGVNAKPIVLDTKAWQMSEAAQLETYGFYPVPFYIRGTSREDCARQLREMREQYERRPVLAKQKRLLTQQLRRWVARRWKAWWSYLTTVLVGVGIVAASIAAVAYVAKSTGYIDNQYAKIARPAAKEKK